MMKGLPASTKLEIQYSVQEFLPLLREVDNLKSDDLDGVLLFNDCIKYSMNIQRLKLYKHRPFTICLN